MIPPLLQQFIDHRGMHPDAVDVLVHRDQRVVAHVRDGGLDLVVKVDAARSAFDHEAVAIRKLAGVGVPVSTVVDVQAGPPAVLVATWAEGVPITSRTDAAVLAGVGNVLRRIHALPAIGPWSGQASVADWITTWVEIVLPWWQETGVDDRLVTALPHWLAEVRPFLGDEHGRQMLFDGRPEHFLVDAEQRLHLIDVADLQPGDPVMDFAVLELDAPGILDPVLRGYAPTPAERDRITQLVQFYVALRAISGAEWQARVGGDTSVVERNLAVAQRLVEGWVARQS